MDKRIEELIKNYNEIRQYLLSQGQVSYVSDINTYYKKILVFSCASLFENEICSTIYEISKSSCPIAIAEFIRNKAIERQYHTYFNWREQKTSSINGFLGLWGDDFKNAFLAIIKSDEKIADGIKAFINIGNERNLMAHENFIEYNSENSFENIQTLYEQADYFVQTLLNSLKAILS